MSRKKLAIGVSAFSDQPRTPPYPAVSNVRGELPNEAISEVQPEQNETTCTHSKRTHTQSKQPSGMGPRRQETGSAVRVLTGALSSIMILKPCLQLFAY
jgi:hypothetical protein